MRVLHVAAGNLFGGVESVLLTLARCRSDCPGLVPEFAVGFEGALAERLRATGVPVHVVGPAKFGRPWTVLATRRRFGRLLSQARPDAVICHGAWAHALLGPTARRKGCRLAFWMHDLAGGRHWLERLARRTPPDLVLANSRYTAGTLPRLFPEASAEVLYCPVPPPVIGDRDATRAEVRRDLVTSAEAVVILQASRLERWKGQGALIEALGRLKDDDRWVAWIVGGVQRPHEQAYFEELRAAAERLGIADRVRFLGQRDDVPRLLAAADLFCQANTGPEPFGIAYVEALWAGLPAVGSRLGGAAEALDESCGALVPPGDIEGLAETLGRLIDDPDRRAQLGAGGPDRARRLCDPAVILNRLHGLLTQRDA
jgi:glycosyltransferase involved in cell wall biosynthesis